MHSAENARNTTLDNENASQYVMSVVVTVLGNQPEAFASDLGDDQSCYLKLILKEFLGTRINITV